MPNGARMRLVYNPKVDSSFFWIIMELADDTILEIDVHPEGLINGENKSVSYDERMQACGKPFISVEVQAQEVLKALKDACFKREGSDE